MNENEPGAKADVQSTIDATEAYKEFGAYERHFNQMQSVCRGFASTWLLATFGGIGYAMWNQQFTVYAVGERTAAASLVALAGGTGIFLLWLIDIVVYHRLLVAVTYESSDLETKSGFKLRTYFENATQAPVRVLRFELLKGEGARKIIAIFYWLPSAFLLAMAIALHVSAWHAEPKVVRVGITLWQVLLLICVLVMIFNKNLSKVETTTGQPSE
jgi:hypothetical protein